MLPNGYRDWMRDLDGTWALVVPVFTGVVQGVVVGGVGLLAYFAWRRGAYRPFLSWYSRNETRSTMGKAALALLLVVGVLAFPYLGGARLADAVRNGGPTGIVANVAETWLLSVQAQPVEVAWMDSQPPFKVPSNPTYLYLGQAGEVTVLLETNEKKVYRVPSSAVALSIDRD